MNGFTLEQAQWLIRFMRNLPGGAPEDPTEDEYARAMNEQRAQAQSMNGYDGTSPWPLDDTEGW